MIIVISMSIKYTDTQKSINKKGVIMVKFSKFHLVAPHSLKEFIS